MKKSKKILSVLLALIMIVSIVPLSSITASAATSGKCGENVTWTYDKETETLTISGFGSMYDYDYDNRPWQECLESIKTVVINNGVTTISDYAFDGCTSLINVTIPDSVTSIGDYAFGSCDSLTNIAVDNDNQYFSNDEYGALFNKDKTTLIQYPIGNARTSYTIPDSVTTIGSFAFESCNKLAEVVIGNSVEIIGISAFDYCGSLTEVIIPDSVKTICDAAFYWCEKLSNIIIGNSVKTIGESAFATCNNLTHIRIPDSVEIIGMTAFCNDGLISITVDEKNLNYSSDEYGVLFNKDKTVLIQYPVNHPRTNYTIPDGVTHVLYCAFISCNGLTSITIPDSVIDITLSAFNNCKNIADVYYKGTEDQWILIRIEPEGNEYLLDANIHFSNCNHSYSDWLITVEPTCTENGLEKRECTKCGEKEARTISKIGHADNDGNGYCDDCEELLDPTVECECNCHKEGVSGFFWNIRKFFIRIFRTNQYCDCGAVHY